MFTCIFFCLDLLTLKVNCQKMIPKRFFKSVFPDFISCFQNPLPDQEDVMHMSKNMHDVIREPSQKGKSKLRDTSLLFHPFVIEPESVCPFCSQFSPCPSKSEHSHSVQYFLNLLQTTLQCSLTNESCVEEYVEGHFISKSAGIRRGRSN